MAGALRKTMLYLGLADDRPDEHETWVDDDVPEADVADQFEAQVTPLRRVGVVPPAALEERLARRVEVDRRLALGEVRVNAHVRPLLVDGRPLCRVVAEPVADGVLDL